MAHIAAVVLLLLSALCLIAGFVVGHPVATAPDRERWINRHKPRVLLRGRPTRYRIAAVLFISATVLGVIGQSLNVVLESAWWLFLLGVVVPVESLIVLDMLQHRTPEPVP